jgi:hypothetical protein
MAFIKNSLILISGFVVIVFLLEGFKYPEYTLFMAYVFYFLTMYGIIYEQYKNYKKGEYSQLTRGDFIIYIPMLLLTIFAYYYFGIMLYDETVSYINNK